SAAQEILGGPRPHPGHAPGERRRLAKPLGHLCLRRRAASGGAAVEGSVPGGAAEEGLWTYYHRDPPGARVLLRRGLPPAIPRQEPERLLRPRRHRRELSGRDSGEGLSCVWTSG